MKVATHARLRRTAVEAVGSIPGIEAVVLYGSRARGTAGATSDWDIAILSRACAEDEQAARRLFGELERVESITMRPESIEAHCNQGTRLESAIARQGRLLAGDWTPPRCRTEDLDVVAEDIERNLDIATGDLRSAFVALCDLVFKGRTYEPRIVEYSQQAAETLAKTIIAGFGLSPTAVHDLNALATQLENAYRGRTRGAEARRRFAAAIRALDGNTRAAHKARYEEGSVEPLARTVERIAGTLRLQTEWLRWYAIHRPEMRAVAVAASREIVDAANVTEEMRGFDRLSLDLQARVRAWGEAGGSIAADLAGE